MKANELRIGNLVNDFGGQPFKVAALCIVALVQCEAAHKIHLGYNPIPLTEEWLVKFGFGIKEPVLTSAWKFSSIGETIVTTCKYVHELQNLYFALTGEELELNEKQ